MAKHVFVAGETVTAALINVLTTDAISTKVTADIAGIATVTTLVTAASVTGDGVKRYKITGSFYGLTGTVAGDRFEVTLLDSTTTVVVGTWRITTTATPFWTDGKTLAVTDVPAVGAHAYRMSMARVSGSGTATVTANANAPIEIIVEQISA